VGEIGRRPELDLGGRHDGAIERFTHAIRLSPLDREMYRMQVGTAAAYLFADASASRPHGSKKHSGICQAS